MELRPNRPILGQTSSKNGGGIRLCEEHVSRLPLWLVDNRRQDITQRRSSGLDPGTQIHVERWHTRSSSMLAFRTVRRCALIKSLGAAMSTARQLRIDDLVREFLPIPGRAASQEF